MMMDELSLWSATLFLTGDLKNQECTMARKVLILVVLFNEDAYCDPHAILALEGRNQAI